MLRSLVGSEMCIRDRLNAEVMKRVEKLVLSKQEFSHGIPFWGHRLLGDDEVKKLNTDTDKAKEFLESLQAYKTPGQLKNFRYSAEEIKACEPVFETVRGVAELKAFADTLSEYTSYLNSAESVLPEDHPWRTKGHDAKKKLRDQMMLPENRKGSCGTRPTRWRYSCRSSVLMSRPSISSEPSWNS